MKAFYMEHGLVYPHKLSIALLDCSLSSLCGNCFNPLIIVKYFPGFVHYFPIIDA